MQCSSKIYVFCEANGKRDNKKLDAYISFNLYLKYNLPFLGICSIRKLAVKTLILLFIYLMTICTFSSRIMGYSIMYTSHKTPEKYLLDHFFIDEFFFVTIKDKDQ